MSRNADLANVLVASAKLEDAGKLDRILAIFDGNNVLTAATADVRHRATAKSAGKVITRNPRQAVKDAVRVETTPEIVKPVAAPKPAPKAAKPAKRTRKPAAKAAKVETQPTRTIADGRTMLSSPGTITAGQKKRLIAKGIDGRKLRYTSMADAAEMYAAL